MAIYDRRGAPHKILYPNGMWMYPDEYERLHNKDEVWRSDAERNLKKRRRLSLADADDAALRPYRNCERSLGRPSSSEAERIMQLAYTVNDALEECIVDMDATRPSCPNDSSHRHERLMVLLTKRRGVKICKEDFRDVMHVRGVDDAKVQDLGNALQKLLSVVKEEMVPDFKFIKHQKLGPTSV